MQLEVEVLKSVAPSLRGLPSPHDPLSSTRCNMSFAVSSKASSSASRLSSSARPSGRSSVIARAIELKPLPYAMDAFEPLLSKER